jgi:serine phosphatase RsbU (regulator of sigma subunit)
MIVEPSPGTRSSALAILTAASERLAASSTLSEGLTAIVEAVANAAGADVAVARIVSGRRRRLVAKAVFARSAALAAELEGSWFPVAALPEEEIVDAELLPHAVARAAARIGSASVVLAPAWRDERPLGSIELLRVGSPFDEEERAVARLAAVQLGLVVRAVGGDSVDSLAPHAPVLELAGDTLAAAAGDGLTAAEITRLSAQSTGADGCFIWIGEGESGLRLVASFPAAETLGMQASAGRMATRALQSLEPVLMESRGGEGGRRWTVVSLRLGEPAIGILQLLFGDELTPTADDLRRLATFGVRAAHALRAGDRVRRLGVELERTQALLRLIGQAISQLSLSHTLETAVEQVAELFEVDQVAVYLREDGVLSSAAERGLTGPHVPVAERLLELIIGPSRGGGLLHVADATADARLAVVQDSVAEAGIEAALAVPLGVQEDVIGLLVVYPQRRRALGRGETDLLAALGGQLAVAVQNARLHEQAKQLGSDLERALASERQAARRLQALYEVSGSFAESLSLDATLEAFARTIVDLLEVDAAVIRLPDERRELLEPRTIHVADPRLAEAARMILGQPFRLGSASVRRLFRTGVPLTLDVAKAAELLPGGLLGPFLERGSTAVVIPLATSAELVGSLSLVSFDPARPIRAETVEVARTIAGQVALAIDNARLYQQQKEFADTMQRSLLPSAPPEFPGYEVGDVYESAARVDVGGDLYDFLVLPDGRLAVVLGDVTGHGVVATADMAMAKFVFRSLAREHPAPGDFLSAANEVVAEELSIGKFVTMLYATVDPVRGEISCASAGHPPPRLVGKDGLSVPLPAYGLALGIEPGFRYEAVTRAFEPGASLVLYTDGVTESRRGQELYGEERLDALLGRKATLPAGELARAVLDDCRAFASGEPADDCAVVVVRRNEGRAL